MNHPNDDRPRGAALFYLAAALATSISADTSWRFLGERLHITALPERAAMFSVIEVALLACGYAMRASVRRGHGPGPARTLAWALAGMAGYTAVALSGPVAGLARVMLGPVLAIVTLHMALGVELRARHGRGTAGVWSRVGRELRERALSRLGLGDDTRDALVRSRDRAADRAARLATGRAVLCRRTRLARAVRTAGVALDAGTRGRMLAQVAAYRHLTDLMILDTPSPWAAELSGSTHPAEVVEAPVGPAHVPAVALADVRRALADTSADTKADIRADTTQGPDRDALLTSTDMRADIEADMSIDGDLSITDTSPDIWADTAAPGERTPKRTSARTSARTADRTSGRTPKADTATAVRKLRDRHPEWQVADIARRLNVTDRTVRRHLNGSASTP